MNDEVIKVSTVKEEKADKLFQMRRGKDISTQPSVSPEADPISKDSKLMVRIFNGVIGLSIFAIFFGLPLFFTGLTMEGAVFEKQLYFYFWLLLGLIAWAAKAVTMGEMHIRRTPLDIPIIGLWLAYLLSTIFSIDRWHSFWGMFNDPSRGLMSVTAAVIFYYLFLSNFNARRMRMATAALLASGAITSVWTLLAILNIKIVPASLAQYFPISLTGSMIGVGIFIASLIPLVAFSILKVAENEEIKKISRIVILALLLVMMALDVFLLLALYNFIPWLALFVGVGLFLVFILSQIVRPKASWTWLPMVLFVLVMAVRMVGTVPLAKINFAEVKPLDYQTSWDIAVNSIKDNALLGSGPATYGYDFSLHRAQNFNDNMFYNLRFLQGSGVIFEAMPTIGILGTFFLIVLLLSFFSVVIYLITRDKEKNKLASLGIFSSALILIGSVALTKTEGTILLVAVFVGILSLAVVLMESGSKENYLSLSLKASPKFALALAFVFMVISAGVAFLFVFLGKVYVADVLAGQSSRIISTDPDNALLKMGKAISYYDKEGKYYTQLGTYYMMLANNEAMKEESARDTQKIRQYLNASIQAGNIGKNMMEKDVSSVESLALIYENAGLYVSDSFTLAEENYKKGLELEPHNPNFYIKLGQIKLAMAASKSNMEEKKQFLLEAKDLFGKATDKKSNMAEGHYQMSIVQDALGEADGAIESGKKAITFANNNSNYIVSLGKLYQNRGKSDDVDNAEQLFKAALIQNDKDINAHFYLGILHEKSKKRQEAKDQYRKVITLLPENSAETKKQLEKMISNIDAGIENTPESLGLTNNQPVPPVEQAPEVEQVPEAEQAPTEEQ